MLHRVNLNLLVQTWVKHIEKKHIFVLCENKKHEGTELIISSEHTTGIPDRSQSQPCTPRQCDGQLPHLVSVQPQNIVLSQMHNP